MPKPRADKNQIMFNSRTFSWECTRCGQTASPLRQPIPVREFVKEGEAFTRQHLNCQPAAPAPAAAP